MKPFKAWAIVVGRKAGFFDLCRTRKQAGYQLSWPKYRDKDARIVSVIVKEVKHGR